VRVGIYRVSREEWKKLRESVPYVKIYRNNPKHLCPKLNGYGDNGQRKVDLLAGPRTVPDSWKSYQCPYLSVVSYYPLCSRCICTSFRVTSALGIHVMYSAWNPKVNFHSSQVSGTGPDLSQNTSVIPCQYPSTNAPYSHCIVYSHGCKILGFTASCNEIFSSVTHLNVSEGLEREGRGCLRTHKVSVWNGIYCNEVGERMGRIIWTSAAIVKITISVTSASCPSVRPHGATRLPVDGF
jgi:hypothetical protein